MNKLIIVGHPASGLDVVEKQLLASGMAKPLPSRREGMLPKQITQVLLKAHGCEAFDEITEESAFSSLEVAPVWHGMAMDLMLGNIDQLFWGWADPASIHLLEYWHSMDPAVVFVLVYDHPASALLALETQISGGSTLSSNAHRALDNWLAYNSALLGFYLRHGARSLLISREQAQNMLAAYLAELQGKLQQQLKTLDEIADPSVGSKLVVSPTWLPNVVPASQAARWQATEVERYLIEQWLADQPDVLQLYAQLQSAGALAPIHSDTPAPVAWEALLQHRELVNQTVRDVWALSEQTQIELCALQAQTSRRLADSSAQASALNGELAASRLQLKASQEQNQLLLQELAHSQEELEKRFLDLSTTRRRVEVETLAKAGALRELAVARSRLDDGQQENVLLLQQLHHVQEELEKQLNDLNAVRERVKAETLAKADILNQREELVRAKTELEEKLQAETQARQRETESHTKVQELEQETSLLLQQLHRVQEELERYHLENQQLKDHQTMPSPNRYGAVDRIKQQLTYRLGTRVLKQLESFWGTLFVYQALAWEVYAFKRDQRAHADEKLPPIREYADAHEAEAVKQHLAYQLGLAVRRVGWNPLKWLELPFALHRVHKAWKRERGKA